ncbi:MAG: OmpA family protein [Syntrophaceae bacterium]
MYIQHEKAQRLIKRLNHLVLKNAGKGYSDIHITGGLRLSFCKNGVLHFGKTGEWSAQEIDCLVWRLLSLEQIVTLKEKKSVVVFIDVKHVRIMVSVYVTTIGLSLTVSYLPGSYLTAEKKKSDMCEYGGRLLALIRNKSHSYVAKIALVTLVFTCVVACTWLGITKEPEAGSTVNKGKIPHVTVTPGIYRVEYGGTALESVEGQTYMIGTDNKKVLPLLPPPEKRLTAPLAIRMSKEVSNQAPAPRPVPVHGENAAGFFEGTARKQAQSKPPQAVMSNSHEKAIIYFPVNQYRLTDSEKDQIKLFLPHLKMAAQDGYGALIEGFTCDLGSKGTNDFLAIERAKAVAGYLEQNGVKIGKIKGEGKHGYISKIKRLNRRVEVQISRKTESQKQS